MSSRSHQIRPVLPNNEKLITILSIDGGGVRGIIPGTILAFLESELQVFPFSRTHSFSKTIFYEDLYGNDLNTELVVILK